MIKKILCLAFLSLSFINLAQKEELTLEASVLQQYRTYYPDNIFGFSFIPNSTDYAYFGQYVYFIKGSANTNQQDTLFSIRDVNSWTNGSLQYFAGMQWKDEENFYLNQGSDFYTVDYKNKSGEKYLTLPEGAENGTLEPITGNVAYTIDNNLYVANKDKNNIAVTKEDDKNIVSGQAIARSEFGITNGIFWSPNGNYMAFYQKDETEVHNYPLLDINAYPGELKSVKYPMAGQKSEKSAVGIYNLKKKKTVYICPKGDAHDYLTNVSWTPDEQYLLIAEVNRDQNKMMLNKYDIKGKFIKTLFTEEATTWVEPEHPAFFPNKANNNFIWITEKDGFNNMYYYDIEGNLIKQLTKHNFIVKDIISSTEEKVVYTATGENATNTLVYSVDLNGNNQLLTKEEGTHSVVVSDNGSFLFDQYSNHATPNVAQLLDDSGNTVRVLLEAENPYQNVKMGTAEISTIKSADGETDLYTRLIKPSNFDPSKKYPVMVYVYGGPHAQMITNSFLDGASLWFYWMAEQGYLVYTVDNRGSSERGKAFESVIHRQLGTAEIADQLEGVKYLKSLPYVDENRLAVNGWSFGGFMTTSLMLREPGTFKVGVAGGPVTDWKYYEVMYGERYMDRPEQNVEGYKTAKLANYVENLEGKLLLIHGSVDDVVVMQHNLALVKEFVEKGKQVDFFAYPMHKHNVRGKDRVHLIEKMTSYIIENNK